MAHTLRGQCSGLGLRARRPADSGKATGLMVCPVQSGRQSRALHADLTSPISHLSHRRLISASSAQPAAEPVTETMASHSKSVPTSSVWEIDFCSRPLLDERNKKIWELLICDPERNFEYSEYFPNSKINSAEVRWGRCPLTHLYLFLTHAHSSHVVETGH